MDNALYVGLSKQMILRRELDIAANNMANVDTTGFKAELLITHDDPIDLPAAPRGSSPVQYALDTGVARDFSQGPLQPTGAPLDMAIDGRGFFQVSTAAGMRYTRDGRFATDAQGQLITQQGDPVLDVSGSPITLNAQGGPPNVGRDGTITQSVPGSPTPAVVGRIGVVTFDDLSALSKQGDGLYANTTNVQPTPTSSASIQGGMLEGSNVQPILQVTDLIRISRAYEAMTNLVGDSSDLSSRAIQRLGAVQ
ncbi:MAG: flagellar basal-body rod protein FlgF [Caulobacteraceae bacterium]|nr:flagellar basal-body rod protein FlgF [Caulobacteraceae bacterium]